MNRPCPFCQGRGKEKPREDGLASLVCEPCNGTGDLDEMRLLRAYQIGREHERAAIMELVDNARAAATQPSIGIDRLRAEVMAMEREAERHAERVLDDETPARYARRAGISTQ